MSKKTYKLETLTCPSCVLKIEGTVNKIKGVNKAEVLFNASKLKVEFDESLVDGNQIRNTVERLGYEVLSEK
ncbi:heavy-metal-associated domain-containing protein [Clostridium fungisolvens]|uniref:Copper chaperone CopZ n=1 Tax=Clostridium fungisolvens TaxID=1604897 RepID=A0A6V8SGT5_9CLOT|nr:cation transporter [Clostridium fungisolvens]GFP76424.1 Copper chaperone CopZ [Clostridium fungisolvens]